MDRSRMRPPADDEELTRAREPLDPKALADYEPAMDTPPHSQLTPTDNTRLVAPRDRRTPAPQPSVRTNNKNARPPTAPPPIPAQRPNPPAASGQKPIPATLQLTPAPMPIARSNDSQPMPQASQSQPLPPQHANASQPLPPQHANASQPLPPQHVGSNPEQQLPPHLAQQYGQYQQPYSPQTPYPQQPYQQPTPNPFQPQQPYYPAQPAGSYPGWGAPIASQHAPRDATPTAKDTFDRPVYPQRNSLPDVAGFEHGPRKGLQPWVLVVGALVMAALAFLITRAAIG